jgi:hypothetical protein
MIVKSRTCQAVSPTIGPSPAMRTARDIVGELGLVFGKKPDLALLLMPTAILVEHAHGLGQPQHEGAEPRAVRMLVTQPDQHTVADGIAGKARSLRRSGGGQ